jgi:hypothetical protein
MCTFDAFRFFSARAFLFSVDKMGMCKKKMPSCGSSRMGAGQ